MTAPSTADIQAAADAALKVADDLNTHGFDIYEPAADKHLLKVTNVRGTLADVIIAPNGDVAWEYHPFAGYPHPPDTTAAIVLTVPGGPPGSSPVTPPPARRPLPTGTPTVVAEPTMPPPNSHEM